MTLIFVGGARSTGKTTGCNTLRKAHPELIHVTLSKEIKKLSSGAKKARDLPLQHQIELSGKVVGSITKLLKTTLLAGHYTASNNAAPTSFVPRLRDVAHLIDVFVLLEASPEEMIARRIRNGKKPRPMAVIQAEIEAEEREARFLAERHGKRLITCHLRDFERVFHENIVS